MNLDLSSLSATPVPEAAAVGLAAPAGTAGVAVPFTGLMDLLQITVTPAVERGMLHADPAASHGASIDASAQATDVADPVELADSAEPADATMGMPAMAAVPPQLLATLGLPLAIARGPSADAGARGFLDAQRAGSAVAATTPVANGAPADAPGLPDRLAVPALVVGTPVAPLRGDRATPAGHASEPPRGGLSAAASPAAGDLGLPVTTAPADPRRTAALEPIANPAWVGRMAEGLHTDGGPALTLAPTTPTQWRQPLADALGDRLQFSLQRGFDQAVIRLDPPNLGRIEIAIRHEAGALQVHMTATHGEVVRQLNAIGDSLRQDLGQRQYGEVSVTVSDTGTGRDADGRPRGRAPEATPDEPGRALAEAQTGPGEAFRLAHDLSETP